eukprot:TRINITY_DN3325_c0_g1_i3.p1 TRINITY_DN3325_c0_g1~~TRINITY_DN3325_c0_g1_i3.p1  ORF type:complete len:284 (-),score=87.25 TRINITY_DN3325_c0_g1_i3:39-830(-)
MSSKNQKKRKAKDSALRGFKPLAVRCSASPQNEVSANYLFFKKHIDKENPDAAGFFVTGVPVTWNLADLSGVFSCFGEVSEAEYIDQPMTGYPLSGALTARVHMSSQEEVEKALALDLKQVRQPFEPDTSIPTGVASWLQDYDLKRPDPNQLQTRVDKFMHFFDLRMQKEKEEEKSGPIVDEEGFTLVRSTKKRRFPLLKEQQEAKERMQNQKKKRSEKQLINFYSHQIKDAKKQQLAELRQKFEEDKKKIEKMKQNRKFNPF